MLTAESFTVGSLALTLRPLGGTEDEVVAVHEGGLLHPQGHHRQDLHRGGHHQCRRRGGPELDAAGLRGPARHDAPGWHVPNPINRHDTRVQRQEPLVQHLV